MNTEVYDWQNGIKDNELNRTVQVLKGGGIVIFPTETVYGIVANAFDKKAVEKIYEVKNRPGEKPLSIMVSGIDEIEKYAIISNNIERKIIESFMPGPITVILKKKPGVFDYISSGKDTIGVRIPDNKIVLEILKKLQLPIVAPSANISGLPSGVDLKDILKDFYGKVDVCIDGGKAKLGEASTIVEVADGKTVILRQGKITLEEIEGKIKCI